MVINETGTDNPHQPWEAQVDWTYVGHGEWAHMEEVQEHGQGPKIEYEPYWVQEWLVKQDEDIARYDRVMKGGYPNRWGAQVVVRSKWNLQLMEQWLIDYEDKEVVQWLRYGWPTGRLPTMESPSLANKNHKGATEHPQQLEKYVQTEKQHGAIMGPFKKVPSKIRWAYHHLALEPRRTPQIRGSY